MKNVLLVDDDSVDIFLGKKILAHMKTVDQVYTSENGKDAIDLLHTFEAARKQLPDVILLDLNMPVMDGFTFLNEFKKISQQDGAVKIFILSSSQNPEDVSKAKDLGADNFLCKPLQIEQLRTYLEAC